MRSCDVFNLLTVLLKFGVILIVPYSFKNLVTTNFLINIFGQYLVQSILSLFQHSYSPLRYVTSIKVIQNPNEIKLNRTQHVTTTNNPWASTLVV